jgi:hypothetical protein
MIYDKLHNVTLFRGKNFVSKTVKPVLKQRIYIHKFDTLKF